MAQKKTYLPISADTERVGKTILDSAYKVHTALGPGLLESVYTVTMRHVLEKAGALVETEVKLPIVFDGEKLESGLRLDMLVDKCVIVELKSVENMNPVYERLN